MKRYLIVEDDEMTREMLRQILLECAPCDVAENGAEGMILFENALLSGNPYSLVCADLMMPEMNGHVLIRKIREFEANQQVSVKHRSTIFVISSSDSTWDKGDLLLDGLCDDYLVKPFDRDALMRNMFKYNLINNDIIN